MILDIADDRHLKIIKTLESDIPDFIKEAQVCTNPDGQPESDYALVILKSMDKEAEKKFNVSTGANTYVSQLYYNVFHQDLEKEARAVAATNIKKAAEDFGIDVSPIVEDNASDTIKTNQVVVADYEPQEKLASVEEVESFVSEEFDGNYHKYSPAQRRSLVMEYQATGVSLTPTMMKYASSGLSPMFRANLMTRKSIIPVETLDEILEKTAALGDEMAINIVTMIDKRYGVDSFYDAGIPDPYETVYEAVPQEEEAPELSKEAASKLAENHELLKNYFDDDIAETLAIAPQDVYSSMSATHKCVVNKIIQEL